MFEAKVDDSVQKHNMHRRREEKAVDGVDHPDLPSGLGFLRNKKDNASV